MNLVILILDGFFLDLVIQSFRIMNGSWGYGSHSHGYGLPRERKEGQYVGLINQGATCYMNSLIQSLFMTSQFRDLIYSFEHDEERDGDCIDCIPFQLQRLFAMLDHTTRAAIDIDGLTASFGWDSMESFVQQDVHETSKMLLDALEQRLAGVGDLKARLVAMFEGVTVNTVKCLSCRTETRREEVVSDVGLEMLGDVASSLAGLLKPERLDGDNQYMCDSCKKKVDADRAVRFGRLPPVLHFHLQRFGYDPQTWTRIKHSEPFAYPLYLDMASHLPQDVQNDPTLPLVDPATLPVPTDDELSDARVPSHDRHYFRVDRLTPSRHIYRLFGLLIHAGSALGGHYYAYLSDDAGDWRRFDDDLVEPAGLNDVYRSFGHDTPAAYMLLYSRVGSTGPPPRPPPPVAMAAVERDNARLSREVAEVTRRNNTVEVAVNVFDGAPVDLRIHGVGGLPCGAVHLPDRAVTVGEVAGIVADELGVDLAGFATHRLRVVGAGGTLQPALPDDAPIDTALDVQAHEAMGRAGRTLLVEVFGAGADVYPATEHHIVVRASAALDTGGRTPPRPTVIDTRPAPTAIAATLADTLGVGDRAASWSLYLHTPTRTILLDNYSTIARHIAVPHRALLEIEPRRAGLVQARVKAISDTVHVFYTAPDSSVLLGPLAVPVRSAGGAGARVVLALAKIGKALGPSFSPSTTRVFTAEDVDVTEALDVGREMAIDHDLLAAAVPRHHETHPALVDRVLPGFAPESGELFNIVVLVLRAGVPLPSANTHRRRLTAALQPVGTPLFFTPPAALGTFIVDTTRATRTKLVDAIRAEFSTLPPVQAQAAIPSTHYRTWVSSNGAGLVPLTDDTVPSIPTDARVLLQPLDGPAESKTRLVCRVARYVAGEDFTTHLDRSTEIVLSSTSALGKLIAAATEAALGVPTDLTDRNPRTVPRLGLLGPAGHVRWSHGRVPGVGMDIWSRYVQQAAKDSPHSDSCFTNHELQRAVLVVREMAPDDRTGYESSQPASPAPHRRVREIGTADLEAEDLGHGLRRSFGQFDAAMPKIGK